MCVCVVVFVCVCVLWCLCVSVCGCMRVYVRVCLCVLSSISPLLRCTKYSNNGGRKMEASFRELRH
jgi:hypothetical protein